MAKKRKGLPLYPTPSLRASLGVDDAISGKPQGVRRFMSLMASESRSICLFGKQPPKISARLASIARDMKELAAYAEGFADGQES